MPLLLRAFFFMLLSLVLAACGSYSDDGVPPEVDNQGNAGTTLFLQLQGSGTQAARRATRVSRAPVGNLTRNDFHAIAKIPDKNEPGGLRDLEIDILEFEAKAGGVYRVAIDGQPRVNVVIYVDVGGVRLKYLVLDPGSESAPAVVDVVTTAATDIFLDAAAKHGTFDDTSLEQAQKIVTDTVNVLTSTPPPPANLSGTDLIDYYTQQGQQQCGIDLATGVSNCPHTVGGTVAGLSGSVVLNLNGGAQTMTVSADGSFAFPTALDVGALWDVAVSQQPAAQHCVVAGGNGTMASDNVTSIQVTCSQAFVVSANVSGAIGSLSLAFNDVPLAVAGNGVVPFPQTRFPGETYAITLVQQPTGQVCQVINGTGSMGTSDVTIDVTCVTNTHVLSGTASGLNGPVTLTLNGTENLTVQASGSFQFASGVAFDSTYSVAIASAPVGQTCVLSSSAGIMPDADVSSVGLVCTINTYSVTASATNGSIISTNPQSISHGSTATVNGSADAGYYFTGVSGCGGTSQQNSNQGVSTFSYNTSAVTAACSVSATFALKSYAVSASATNGSITSTNPQTINHGSTATINGSADAGYYFTGVSGCNGTSQQNSDQTVSTFSYNTGAVTAACSVSATFALKSYAVSASASNGSITSTNPQTINHGSTATVNGSANAGYYFTGVSGCGGTSQQNSNQGVSTFSYNTGAVTAACSVSATFALKSYAVSASATNGSITSTNPQTINHGSTATVTGSADAGYYFAGVSGCNGTSQQNSDQTVSTFSYTTGAITGACSVSATFALKSYDVGASATNGSITSTNPQTADHGTKATVTGQADTGYYLESVSGCGGTTLNNTNQRTTTFSYTTDVLSAACSVTASFVSQTPVTVGGTITGLAESTQITFALNGQASSETSTGTRDKTLPFSFPDSLLPGDSYAVTISTQPVGQVCELAQASGTVGAANVTTVQVVCKSLQAYLSGSWTRVQGSQTSVARFSVAGDYLMAMADETTPPNSGTEYGSFTLDSSGNVGVEPADDQLAGGLNQAGVSHQVSFTNGDLVITNNDGVNPPTTTTWSRITTDPLGLQGSWLIGDHPISAGSGMVSFLAGNRVMLVKPSNNAFGTDPCALVGVELAKYLQTSSGISFSEAVVDTNGCEGLHDPGTDAYETLSGVSFVDLDGDATVREGMRFTGSDATAKVELIFREGYSGQPATDVIPRLKGNWVSVKADGSFDQTARAVFRFDEADAISQQVPYMNGVAKADVQGYEVGTLSYDASVGRVDAIINKDTNGPAGLGQGGSAPVVVLPGTTSNPEYSDVIIHFENDSLYVYRYRADKLVRYERSPQHQAGSVLGTWAAGRLHFGQPEVTFFADGSYFLIDTDSDSSASCNTAGGIEFGHFSYSSPVLTITPPVYDTDGCGGLWNANVGLSNVSDTSVTLDESVSPGPGLRIGSADLLYPIANDGTLLLEPSFVVSGYASFPLGPVTLNLQDASGSVVDTFTLGQSGNFQFSYTLPNGGFSVGVGAVPPGYQCTVTPSAGVIDGAPPSSVEVVCNPLTYTVSGTVTGFKGTMTVSLKNGAAGQPLENVPLNNADPNANIPLNFVQPLFNGEAYAVVVDTQPAGQYCSVSNAAGVIQSASVSSVLIQCAATTIEVGEISPHTLIVGEEVAISGSGLSSASVTLGGVAISTFRQTDHDLRFVVPDNVTAGYVPLQLTAFTGGAVSGIVTRTVGIAPSFLASTNPSSLASGGGHSCAIDTSENHQVYCWGANGLGQIGLPAAAPLNQWVPVAVPGLTGASAVMASEEYSCAVMVADGSVKCWGANYGGQLGNGTAQDTSIPQTVLVSDTSLPLTGVTQISGSADHLCAVAGGDVYCWGENANAVLDDALPHSRIVKATRVFTHQGSDLVASVATGFWHICIRMGAGEATGAVLCWGRNTDGQFGPSADTGALIAPASPIAVAAVAKSVVVGEYHSCILQDDDTVACLGSNQHGQLLLASSVTASSTLQTVTGLSGVTALQAGYDYSCAVINGQVYCWGGNESGQLGDGTKGIHSGAPLLAMVADLTGASQLALGGTLNFERAHACALVSATPAANQARVRCWGWGDDGQLGNDDALLANYRKPTVRASFATPEVFTGGRGMDAPVTPTLMASYAHTCVLDNPGVNGTVSCAGAHGQTGDGFDMNSSVLRLVPFTGIVSLALGDAHTCAVGLNGNVTCWGDDVFGAFDGQLSQGTLVQPDILVSKGGSRVAISAGSGHTCAMTDNGLGCWGNNVHGQLGSDAPGSSSWAPVSPVNLPASLLDFDLGGDHGCAVTTDSQVKCWGSNAHEELGNGSVTDAFSAVTVQSGPGGGDLFGASAVSAGFWHTCALLSDGSPMCWGDNSFGQLMQDIASVPMAGNALPINGVSGLVSLSAGDRMTCGVQGADGRVVCWGADDETGVPGVRHIEGIIGARSVSVADSIACASLIGDESMCWGIDHSGALAVPVVPSHVRLDVP